MIWREYGQMERILNHSRCDEKYNFTNVTNIFKVLP